MPHLGAKKDPDQGANGKPTVSQQAASGQRPGHASGGAGRREKTGRLMDWWIGGVMEWWSDAEAGGGTGQRAIWFRRWPQDSPPQPGQHCWVRRFLGNTAAFRAVWNDATHAFTLSVRDEYTLANQWYYVWHWKPRQLVPGTNPGLFIGTPSRHVHVSEASACSALLN
jgi:hypothetical protein